MAVYVPDNTVRHTTNEELQDRLGYHKATPITMPLHESTRNMFIGLSQVLNDEIPEGREKSLMFTALQEALMWANASIAINLAPLEGD